MARETSDPPVLHLVLTLRTTEPVAGSLTTEGGTELPFSGWLGLHALLGRLQAEHLSHVTRRDTLC